MSADSETGTKQFLRNSKLDCRVHDNMPYACTRSFNRFLNLALARSFRKREINHLCADFATAVECCIITKSTLAALSRFGPRCQQNVVVFAREWQREERRGGRCEGYEQMEITQAGQEIQKKKKETNNQGMKKKWIWLKQENKEMTRRDQKPLREPHN